MAQRLNHLPLRVRILEIGASLDVGELGNMKFAAGILFISLIAVACCDEQRGTDFGGDENSDHPHVHSVAHIDDNGTFGKLTRKSMQASESLAMPPWKHIAQVGCNVALADRSVKDKGIASSLTGVKTSMGPNKCKQVVDNMDNNQCQNGSTMMLCESRDGQMLGMRLVASLERLVLTILSTRKIENQDWGHGAIASFSVNVSESPAARQVQLALSDVALSSEG
ncbi:uncharacterized protein NECHADRAFT_87113 [Fusarium vanettenii 77-13-4]|uniref:Uncharacterized protein n=1 Tax=Fusarium vanettenii (strain ATCC MYA-4622 / CBS 123669 / FGSC 9596 / NRRL 45880 / 77-13-4) TaxID=660122 RepID=C7ZIE4_FUSV7|nr:uncharacterized protein NECHADRAFT_87113 [Fusarium vanettenii 77-13-4]EEU36247.1 predicted protein [Fusarium vanettenii 77-13-4]